MDTGVIAKRYAKALLQYAQEQNVEDTIYKEVSQYIATCQELPRYVQALSNPLLTSEQKVSLLCKAVSAGECSPVFQKFAELVVAHHRESFMVYFAHSYIRLYRQYKHISIGELITAVPVTDEVSKRLEDWIEDQSKHSTDVIMHHEVNPDILGGFIFRIDDYRLDASVATQFEQIKKQFIEKNKRII